MGSAAASWCRRLAAVDLLGDHPRATLAVIDGAGHALPHERPELLADLIDDWLGRTTTTNA